MLYAVFESWEILPDTIPIHYNASGEPDAWGSKFSLVFLPCITIVLYGSLTILGRYPHIFNFPWKITEQNAERQYILAKQLLSWLKAEVIWVFYYIEWNSIEIAFSRVDGLSTSFLPIFLGTITLSIVVYLVLASRAR